MKCNATCIASNGLIDAIHAAIYSLICKSCSDRFARPNHADTPLASDIRSLCADTRVATLDSVMQVIQRSIRSCESCRHTASDIRSLSADTHVATFAHT